MSEKVVAAGTLQPGEDVIMSDGTIAHVTHITRIEQEIKETVGLARVTAINAKTGLPLRFNMLLEDNVRVKTGTWHRFSKWLNEKLS
mgnify:CR=1 FL=1